jgi:hypothetical protein
LSTTVASQNKQVTFEQVKTEYFPEWCFRPKTIMAPFRMNFIFLNGGMGDYAAWQRSIEWLCEKATWIHGALIVPTYFVEFAEHFIGKHKHWTVCDYKSLEQIPKVNELPFRGPVELQRESLNATGAHLATCGWVYFTNKEKAPPGYEYYSQFEQSYLDGMELPDEAKGLEQGKYAIFTTGMTTDSRKVPPGGWVPIIQHVIDKGLTPVFLGKDTMITGNALNIHTSFDPSIDFTKGIDLRNKTSMLQAASIMSRAAFVIGHDNGLLHLAGCTEVPIIFGYNIALPEHREPLRKVKKTYNVVLNQKELACYGCQSEFNFLINFNFRKCLYDDLACMSKLFSNGGDKWKQKIDLVLAGKPDVR